MLKESNFIRVLGRNLKQKFANNVSITEISKTSEVEPTPNEGRTG